MLVNNLETRKLPAMLLGIAALVALVVAALASLPQMDLYYNVIPGALAGYLTVERLMAVVGGILSGWSWASLIALIGAGWGPGGAIIAAIRSIGYYTLRYYVRRFGYRAVAAW